MPYASANSYILAGVEATRGTLSSALKDMPLTGPQLSPMQKFIKDLGLRGSPGMTYDEVIGVVNAEYECKVNVFADTFPIFVRAALGAADSVTAAGSATTLSASAGLGATSVTLTASASYGAGSAVIIGSGSTAETHLVVSFSGNTATLASPLLNNQSSGAAVTGLTAHKLQLENDTSGSQPPSLSIQDFDGYAAYQLLAAQLSELSLSHGAEKALECSIKFVANPFTSIGNPSLTVGAEHFIPSWDAEPLIGGTLLTVLEEGSIDIKRNNTASIFTENGTGGQGSPHANFAGPITVTGAETFVVESGDSMLTYGTTYDKLVVVREWTDPVSNHMIHIQMSRVQYQDPKHLRGKDYVEVSANFEAEMNTTDASSGYSPISVTVANAVSTSY